MKPFPFSPARRDLVIKQGATWIYPITWERPAGTPVDISGFTARMQIRDDAYSSTVLVDMTTANGRITIDGPAGTVTLILADDLTAALSFRGTAAYDLELVQASPRWVVPLIGGSVTLMPEVTR